MQGKWVVVTVALLVVGVAGGVIVMRRRSAPPVALPRAAAALELPASGIVTFTGAIRAQHVTNVGASVEGNIEMFLADVGQEVSEGEALARIAAPSVASDREDASNAVERARDEVSRSENALSSALMEQSRAAAEVDHGRAGLDTANREYQRQRVAFAQGATPRLAYENATKTYQTAVDQFEVINKALDAATTEARNAQAAVDAAKAALEAKLAGLDQERGDADAASEVRSPVDGLVVARNGDPGKPGRDSGDQMFVIATDLSALEVTVTPPPAVLGRIVPGLPAMVLVPELTSAGFQAEVKGIDNGVVVVQFVSGLASVRPGMKADVRIKLN